VQAKRARGTHAAHFEMSGVRGWDDAGGKRSRRRMPARGRCFIIETFMRPHVVVGLHKRVEDVLLPIGIGGRRPRRVRFQHAMHAFVRPVLLRTRGRNALVRDAELQPPRVEAIQSVNVGRREKRASVLGQPRDIERDEAFARLVAGIATDRAQSSVIVHSPLARACAK
jgi:hypothetical protein